MAVGGGRVFVKDDPSTGEAIAELLRRNGGKAIEAVAERKPNEPDVQAAGGEGRAPAANPSRPARTTSPSTPGARSSRRCGSTRSCGEIRVSRFVGAFAAGRILNAKTARSQIMGGIVWGISMALHEETILDPNRGKIVNDNLADYLVPVNPDVPAIDCFFVEEDDPHVNPLGGKGIGELGITGIGGGGRQRGLSTRRASACAICRSRWISSCEIRNLSGPRSSNDIMKPLFTLCVLTLLIAVAPNRCFGMMDIEEVTPQRAKELGLEIRTIAAGPDAVRVELEFEAKGDLKDFVRVDLQMTEGENCCCSRLCARKDQSRDTSSSASPPIVPTSTSSPSGW